MEIQVSRALFGNEENIPRAMNKPSIQLTLTNESLTPKGKHEHNDMPCRGDLSTPRPKKERQSPLCGSDDTAVCTPPEPTAPMKEKCKSDPRKSSQDMSTGSGASAIFENPNVKALVFEDERTLAPLGHSRRGLKSAGMHRHGGKGKKGGESNMRTPKKGTVAWGSNEDDRKDSNRIPLISGFNVLVGSPDPLSKYHEEIKVVHHEDFDMAGPGNGTPQKQTVSRMVKQLHNELDTPPDEVKHIRHRYNAPESNKVAMNLFTTDISPDGIAGIFSDTVSPFKANYKHITKQMHGTGSLTDDFNKEPATKDNDFDYSTDQRPATSPDVGATKRTGKPPNASTPERKTSKATRPKPSYVRRQTNVSHIGNTEIQPEDTSKVKHSSPVPAAPRIGKFRKKLNMCLSPLTEGTNEVQSSPEQDNQIIDTKNTCISPLVVRHESIDAQDNGVSALEAEVAGNAVLEKLSRNNRPRTLSDVDVLIDVAEDTVLKPNKQVKPSRPSMPPSGRRRPKPSPKVGSGSPPHKESENTAKVGDPALSGEAIQRQVTVMEVPRMKFVPMPKRKNHKVERFKFNPRLENILEDEEASHKVPRWLTIFRRRRNEAGHAGASRPKAKGLVPSNSSSIENNCDNSLLSSTILLISDGVVMDGVDPAEENHTDIPKVKLSGVGGPKDTEEDDQFQDSAFREKLASYFNNPEGTEQAEDYAGFECIFNRFGAKLKEYVEAQNDINTVIDASGNNLLHAAAYIGWDRAVKFLIRRGVSVNHTNNYGVTPLVYAIEFENYDIRDYLLKKGATAIV